MEKQLVDLSNVKYAINIEGGGWTYEHKLHLIMNNGDVYTTEEFTPEEVVPTNSIEAYFVGKVDVSKDFVVPEKKFTSVCDAPRVNVYDNKLEKAIYKAYGMEDEYKEYFKEANTLLYDFYLKQRTEEYKKIAEENKRNRAMRDEKGFLLRNENAYSNGKKMTADEFFAMSGMLLDNMDAPKDMEK